mmetsp:Transcript_9069/g.28067  ORF Transcript_9069/g.28067 Transcript_9069/m.28067 type:complete len:313 (-) Transcript_9069:2059-2997(-)
MPRPRCRCACAIALAVLRSPSVLQADSSSAHSKVRAASVCCEFWMLAQPWPAQVPIAPFPSPSTAPWKKCCPPRGAATPMARAGTDCHLPLQGPMQRHLTLSKWLLEPPSWSSQWMWERRQYLVWTYRSRSMQMQVLEHHCRVYRVQRRHSAWMHSPCRWLNCCAALAYRWLGGLLRTIAPSSLLLLVRSRRRRRSSTGSTTCGVVRCIRMWLSPWMRTYMTLCEGQAFRHITLTAALAAPTFGGPRRVSACWACARWPLCTACSLMACMCCCRTTTRCGCATPGPTFSIPNGTPHRYSSPQIAWVLLQTPQ